MARETDRGMAGKINGCMVSCVDGELCVFLDGHVCKQRSVNIERKMDSQESRRKMDEWKDIQVCGWAGG